MVCNSLRRALAGVAISLVAISAANAALQGRAPLTPGDTDYQAYYDTNLNITWLADANLPLTNSFGVSGICISGPECRANLCDSSPECVGEPGIMTWYIAQDWLAAMNATSYLGVGNWRLPSMDVNGDGRIQQSCGIPEPFIRDNQLAYMYCRNHVQGSSLSSPFSNVGRSDYFFGLVPSEYASSTVDPVFGTVWYLPFGGPPVSGTTRAPKGELMYVWPVAPGDPLNAVPVPAGAWLFPSALVALGWVRRRRIHR